VIETVKSQKCYWTVY